MPPRSIPGSGAITVEEGDRVAKGTVLARIRTAEYEQ
jgi:multidrug efflux pump subunit AcrA (membrane-fusion protein)